MSMRDWLNSLESDVSSWEGVSVEPHRFGGVEFRLDGVEIGHMHRNGMIDIPFSRALREALISEGAAEQHHLLPETGWISYYLRAETDTEGARRLFRLSYLHKRGRRGRIDHSAELNALGFSPATIAAAGPRQRP